MSDVNFYKFIGRTGSEEAARFEFEEMIAQLVRISYPAAHQIRANPGDWGIDVFAGELDNKVFVWQSKFFFHGIGKPQQQEI